MKLSQRPAGWLILVFILSALTWLSLPTPSAVGPTELQIVGNPVRISNGWQITFNSIPGKTYRLQKIAGDAIPLTNIQWIDLNTVSASGATAIATDDTAGTSQRYYRIVLLSDQVAKTVGQLMMNADTYQTNGVTVTASGNIRIGQITFSADTSMSVDTSSGIITGNGKASLNGTGLIVDGSFQINANTAELTVSSSASIVTNIALSSLVSAQATDLKVNVNTGAISGHGTISMGITATAGAPKGALIAQASNTVQQTVTFSGDFTLDPQTKTLTVNGSVTYNGVTLTGAATIPLSGFGFTSTGQVSIHSGDIGDNVQLGQANFDLKLNAQSQAEFTLGGKPVIVVLASLGVSLTGHMDLAGNIKLTGQSAGAFGPFSFNPVEVTLQRDGEDGARVAILYRGVFQVQGLSPLVLNGQVQLDGTISPPELEGDLALGASLQIHPPASRPTKLRVSVKFILDAAGNRPTGILASDSDVIDQITRGNDILQRAGNKYQFELVEIENIAGASQWFDLDARTNEFRLELQKAVLTDPIKYKFRLDAVNIYINGNSNSGNSALIPPDQIILIGQGGPATTLPHEMGHFFSLYHTQGRQCGYCGEGPKNDPSLCQTRPDSDGVDDTIGDLGCWNVDAISLYNFGSTYDLLSPTQRAQVDDVFHNLMSYHDDQNRLTPGQMVRFGHSVNGPRFHVADRPTVLDFVKETTGVLDFNVDGEFDLVIGTTTARLALKGTASVEKTTSGVNVKTFTATTEAQSTNLLIDGLSISNATVSVVYTPGVGFEIMVNGRASFGGIVNMEVTGKVVNGQLVLTAKVPAIQKGDFRLESTSADGAFTATLTPTSLAVPSGARLLYKGQPLTTPSLPAITLGVNGDFSVSANASMTVGLKLNAYDLSNSTFTFQVAGGVASVQNFTGTLRIPGLSAVGTVGLSGSLNSDGKFSLSGTASSGLTFTDLALATVSAGATVTLTQDGLSITGTLNGRTIAQYKFVPPTVTLVVSATGEVSFKNGVTATLSPIVVGNFRLESTSPGGSFTVSLTADGFTIPSGGRLLYKGAPLATATLPAISVSANGNLNFTADASMTVGLKLNGFDLKNSSFQFHINAGAAFVDNFTAGFTIPGLSVSETDTMTGSLNSDGTFRIASTTSNQLDATPYTGIKVILKSATTFAITQDGLIYTLDNNQVGPLGGVATSGTLTVLNNNGVLTGTINASVQMDPISVPPTNPVFQIMPTAAGATKLGATINGTQISLSGAKLKINNVLANEIPLPQISLQASGDFSALVASATMQFIYPGKATTIASQNSFTLNFSGGQLAIANLNGTITVPGYNHTEGITGSINGDGSFNLHGTTATQTTLALPAMSFAPPVAVMNSGASLTLQRTVGAISSSVSFTLAGNVAGGLLSSGLPAQLALSPGFTASATLQLSSDGPSGLTGNLDLAGINFGNGARFQLLPRAGATKITASLSPTKVTFTGSVGLGMKLNVSAPSFSPVGDINPIIASINADGTFSITVNGALLTIAGFPISASNFTLTPQGLTSFVGNLNIPAFNVPVSVNGSISMQASIPIALTGGAGSLPDLTYGKFHLKASGGVSFNGLSITLISPSFGIDGLLNTTAVTDPISIDANGGFANGLINLPSLVFSVSGTSGFTFGNDKITLGRNSSVMTVAFQGSYMAPGLSGSLSFNGSISSNAIPDLVATGTPLTAGRFTLSSPSAAFNGLLVFLNSPTINAGGVVAVPLPVPNIQFGPSATFTQVVTMPNISILSPISGGDYLFNTVQFSLKKTAGGMSIGDFTGNLQVAGLPSIPFTTLGPIGESGTWSLWGTPNSIDYGIFHITYSGGAIPLTLSSSAALYIAGGALNIANILPSPASLGSSFTIKGNGEFSVLVGPVTMNLDGYTFQSGRFAFARTGTTTSLNVTAGSFNPNFGSTADLKGLISSDGSMNLSHTFATGSTMNGFGVQGGASLVSGSLRYRSTMLLDQPYAYWRFADKALATGEIPVAVDQMKGHDGTPSSTIRLSKGTPLVGVNDTGFTFGGTDRVTIPSSGDFNQSGAMAVEAWVRVSSFSGAKAYDAILGKGDSAWRVQRYGSTSRLSFDTDGLNPPYLAGNRNVDDGQWHHVVAVYDGTKKYLYIDGTLDASVSVTGAIAVNNYDVLIGANSQVGGRSWNGDLDEVAFYKQALSSADVIRHYAAAKGSALSAELQVQVGTIGSVTMGGGIKSDGTYNMTGATTAAFNFGNFPITQVQAGAAATWSGNSLQLAGTLSGGVLTHVPVIGTVTGTVGFNGSGPNAISGSATFSPIVRAPFRVESSTGGDITASFNTSGLTVSGARLQLPGVFNAAVSLPDFTIASTGNFSRSVGPVDLSIVNYPFTSVNFTLNRSSDIMSVSGLAGNINVPGFSQHFLNGSIDLGGSVTLDYSGAFSVGGFNAAGSGAGQGYMHLRNTGLTAGGSFTIDAVVNSVARTYGSATFSGTIGTSGNVNLNSSQFGSLNLGGYGFDYSNGLKLSQNDLSGPGNLNYGVFDFGGTFKISKSAPTPVSFSAGTSGSKTQAWGVQLDGSPGHPYGTFNWSASCSFDGASVNASVSGQVDVEYEKIGGGYGHDYFNFPSMGLSSDGGVTLSVGSYGSHTFNLP